MNPVQKRCASSGHREQPRSLPACERCSSPTSSTGSRIRRPHLGAVDRSRRGRAGGVFGDNRRARHPPRAPITGRPNRPSASASSTTPEAVVLAGDAPCPGLDELCRECRHLRADGGADDLVQLVPMQRVRDRSATTPQWCAGGAAGTARASHAAGVRQHPARSCSTRQISAQRTAADVPRDLAVDSRSRVRRAALDSANASAKSRVHSSIAKDRTVSSRQSTGSSSRSACTAIATAPTSLRSVAEVREVERHAEVVLAQRRDRRLQVVALLAGHAELRPLHLMLRPFNPRPLRNLPISRLLVVDPHVEGATVWRVPALHGLLRPCRSRAP